VAFLPRDTWTCLQFDDGISGDSSTPGVLASAAEQRGMGYGAMLVTLGAYHQPNGPPMTLFGHYTFSIC